MDNIRIPCDSLYATTHWLGTTTVPLELFYMFFGMIILCTGSNSVHKRILLKKRIYFTNIIIYGTRIIRTLPNCGGKHIHKSNIHAYDACAIVWMNSLFIKLLMPIRRVVFYLSQSMHASLTLCLSLALSLPLPHFSLSRSFLAVYRYLSRILPSIELNSYSGRWAVLDLEISYWCRLLFQSNAQDDSYRLLDLFEFTGLLQATHDSIRFSDSSK